MPGFVLIDGVPQAQTATTTGSTPGDNVVRDILQDDDGDWVLYKGDLQLAVGKVGIVQGVSNRLKSFKGEWFLDLDAGMPYFQDIFVKAPNLNAIRQVFVEEILKEPGMVSVDSCDVTLDRTTRKLVVKWAGTGDVGKLADIVEVTL